MVSARVAHIVESVVDQDPVIQEAQRRGFVNLRALARWIIETQNLDTSEEAVLSAIRRRKQAGGVSKGLLDEARETMQHAHVNMRSHLAIIALNKTDWLQERLPRLFQTVDYTKGETLRVIQSERSIKIVVDEENLEAVLDVLGEEQVSEVHRGLAEVHIMLPSTGQQVPGIGGLMLLSIGMRGINIHEVITGIPEALIIVREKDALDACDAIMDLIGESKRTPPDLRVRSPITADTITPS